MSIQVNLIIHTICFLTVLVVFFALRVKTIGKKRYTHLKVAVGEFAIVIFFDALIVHIDNVKPCPMSYNAAYFVEMAYNIFYVMAFAVMYELAVKYGMKKSKITVSIMNIGLLLAIISVSLMVIFKDTDMFMSIQDGEVIYGNLYTLWLATCGLLILGVVVESIHMHFNSEMEVYKNSLKPFFYFSIYVIIAFAFVFFDHTSVLPVIGMAAWSLYMYINTKKHNVFRDELTGMSNVMQMLRDIDDYFNDGLDFCFWLFNIKELDTIESFYGQGEKENAIKLTADAIRNVTLQEGGYPYRYSDEEFAVIRVLETSYHYLEIEKDINSELDKHMVDGGLPYKVSVDCGKVIYDEEKHFSIHDIIRDVEIDRKAVKYQ